jgi:hypothetical protein
MFEIKGFNDRVQFNLGNWKLWLYRKQLINVHNYYKAEDGWAVFCCGTVVYRSLGYSDSLERLLCDFRKNLLDQDELIGHFCLLFWDGRQLTMLTDRLNIQHVFTNKNLSCLSSSFLAVLVACPHPLPLNRLAAYEKFTTGYILSPDTIVEGIQKVNEELKKSFKDGLTFIRQETLPMLRKSHNKGYNESIERQLNILNAYFKSIDRLHCEYGGELGLSNGYDCRLLLALSRRLARPIGLHTHNTIGVHEAERRIAEKLSNINGNEIISHPTKRMEEQTEERLKGILEDSLYFFDGRCANSIGAFSEIYTVGYRKKSLGKHRLSLNGLGGEIFRNSHCTPITQFSWAAWMNRNVYYPYSSLIVTPPNIYKNLKKHIHQKIENNLQLSIPEWVDLHTAHSYYGLVRMPECAGNVNNAYGQVSFFLTPFIEYQVIREALKAVPYIGCNGRYQAAMICHAAPDLAEVMSHYGFPFSTVSLAYLLKSKLKSTIPLSFLNIRQRLIFFRKKVYADLNVFEKFCSQSKTIREILNSLMYFFPESDWSNSFLHYAQRRATIFTGFFLMAFSGKIQR